MMKNLVFMGMVMGLLGAAGARAAEIRPFTTDGCTKWREGTRKNPTQWRHCCVLHDLAFWAGGLTPGRPEADLALRDCVAATGARFQAELMYAGVRLGSRAPRKIPGMQWGNAWDAEISRRSDLTRSEIDELERELTGSRYDPELTIEARRTFLEKLRAE